MNTITKAGPTVAELLPTALDAVAESDSVPSLRALMREHGIGQAKARELRAEIEKAQAPDTPAELVEEPEPTDRHAEKHEEAPDTPEPRRESPWPRRIAVLATVAVAVVAAAVSFDHMYLLASTAGETWTALLIPVSVDGLIVAAGAVMWSRSRRGVPVGVLAAFSLVLGVVVSIAANVATSVVRGTGSTDAVLAAVVAGWAPVALFLTYELLMQLVREQA